MFWVLAGLMTIVVVALLLVPQLRGYASAARRAEYDVNVYKDQLVELDRDQAEGRIGGAEADAARLEIQRRLLAAADDAEGEDAQSAASGKGKAMIVAAVLTVYSMAVYLRAAWPFMKEDHPL